MSKDGNRLYTRNITKRANNVVSSPIATIIRSSVTDIVQFRVDSGILGGY